MSEEMAKYNVEAVVFAQPSPELIEKIRKAASEIDNEETD